MFADTNMKPSSKQFHTFQVIRSTNVQTGIALHFLFLFPRLSALQKHTFYHDFSPQNNDAYVEVIPRLDVSYLMKTNWASVHHCGTKQDV